MTGLLGGHLQQMVALWTGLMVAVGGLTVLVMVLRPWWRERLPLMVPLLVGVLGLAAAVVLLGPAGLSRLLLGRPPATSVPALDALGPGLAVVGVLVAVGGALASFSLEAALLRRRGRRRASAGIPLPGGAGMPSRRESIDGVARVARRPALFAAVSLVSAAGEEALFRGVMLAPVWLGEQPAGLLVLVQAVLFGALHLAFGWRSVLAKVVLGLALAVGALSAGLLLGALLPHLVFQLRVLAQFRRSPSRPERSLAHA